MNHSDPRGGTRTVYSTDVTIKKIGELPLSGRPVSGTSCGLPNRRVSRDFGDAEVPPAVVAPGAELDRNLLADGVLSCRSKANPLPGRCQKQDYHHDPVRKGRGLIFVRELDVIESEVK